MELYKKYRPKTLADVVGQDSVCKSLAQAVSNNNLPHVILFSGSPGVGKTTLARIVANMIGCNPMNIDEMNAADDRGIDAARKLHDKSRLTPLGGGNSAVILDEAHAITPQGFQALLKLLEDTPEHLYFFLCTSNPDKIPKAIRSRVTHYELADLNHKSLTFLIQDVSSKENFQCPCLPQIIKASEGSARTALVLLDQLRQASWDISLIPSSESPDNPELYRLVNSLMTGKDWTFIANTVDSIPVNDLEPARWYILQSMYSQLKKGVPKAAKIIGFFEKPFFDSKKPGFLAACWHAYNV